MLRRITLALFPLLTLLGLVGCGDSTKLATIPTITIILTPATATLKAGQTTQFTATVTNASTSAVIWEVNSIVGGNATVGTISNSGLYTAPASISNSATITILAAAAANTAVSATATISLEAPPVTLSISPTSATLLLSATEQFTAKVLNTANLAVTWQVNGVIGGNATVGTISTSGLYTAPAALPSPSSVTVKAIAAADTSVTATAAVTLTAPPPPITVSVTPTTASLLTGASQQFSATVTGTSNTDVTWQVNNITGGNTTVGTISASGLYNAPATVPSPANVTIKATSVAATSMSASATVTIKAPVTIKVAPGTATVAVNKTQLFVATVTGSSNTSVQWQVNGVQGGNTTVGAISASGLYTAPASVPSPAIVTVTAVSTADPTKSAHATVTVAPPPSPVTVVVAPASVSLVAGSTQQFSAQVSNAASDDVTWQVNGVTGGSAANGFISSSGLYSSPSTPPNPATVAVQAISVDDSSAFGTAAVTITPKPVVAVSVLPKSVTVPITKTQTFTATVTGTSNTSVQWQVAGVQGGNSSVGTINTSGVYTAPDSVPAPANVTVTAVSNADPSKSDNATVTIDLPGPTSVTVAPPTANTVVGQTQQFTATVSPSDADQSVIWALSGSGCTGSECGSINSAGLYQAPSTVPGSTVTVKATAAGDATKSGTAVVTVQPVPQIGISISPSNTVVSVGQTLTFTATLTNDPGGSTITWQRGCINWDEEQEYDPCDDYTIGFEAEPNNKPDGPGTINASDGSQGPVTVMDTSSVIYTAPAQTFVNDQANPTACPAPTTNAVVPLTATVTTSDGHTAFSTVCVLISQP